MMRLLPHLLFSAFLFLHTTVLRAQCGYRVALNTNKDYCTGATLRVSSSHTLETITWYKDGQPIDSAKAAQSPFFPNGLAAGGHGDGNAPNQCRPLALFVDEAGNLYTLDGGRARVQKWRPGSTVGENVAGNNAFGDSADQLRDGWDISVDRQGNIFVNDFLNSRVMKWAPGADSGTTVVQFPKDHRNQGMFVDCDDNVWIANQGEYPGYTIVLYKVPAGSTTPIPVFSNNGDAHRYGSIQQIFIDPAGTIFINDIYFSRVLRWLPATNTFETVAGGSYNGGFNDGMTPSFIWMDGKDTIWGASTSTLGGDPSIRKYASGSGVGTEVLGTSYFPPTGGQKDNPGALVMDNKGNLFVADPLNYRVLKFSRKTTIDSSFTPTVPGIYYAVVTDLQGYSQTTDSLRINIPNAPPPSISITATATSTPVCTPISFTATVANPGVDAAYQWEVSGVKAGDGSLSYSNSLFANGDQVYCILTTQAGCTDRNLNDTSNIITLDIDPHGTATLTIDAAKTAVCKGSPIDFTATVTNSAPDPVFQWMVNGFPVAGDNGPTYRTDTMVTGDVVDCYITSNNICGLAKSNSIPVIVSIPPVIAPNQVFDVPYGRTITLDPVVSGDVSTWLWSPAYGLSDTTVENPLASPLSTTSYTLKVMSAGGCGDTGTILVNVYTLLSLPNAFTPNGDGHNDLFFVMGGPASILIEEFSVFSRWGQAVFQVHDVAPGDRSKGWDGRVNGQPTPPGTYVYIVVVKNADGTRHVYKGTLVLIR